MGSSLETAAAWFLGRTRKPTSHHLWLSSKGVLHILQSSLEDPACVDTFLLLVTQQAEHEFGGNHTYVQIFFQNSLSWPKLYSQRVSNFMVSDSAVFEGKFLQSFTLLSVLFVDGLLEPSASSAEVILGLNFENHSKNCVMTTAASPGATINMSRVSITTVRTSSHTR